MSFVETVLAPKGLLFWLATLVCGVIATAIYLANAPHRDAVDAGLTVKDGKALCMFALCRKHGSKWDEYSLPTPERLFCYDKSYFDAFVSRARDNNVLARYVRPTLLWNDVVFAIAFGVFVALLALWIGSLLPWSWARHVALFCAAMAIAYAIIDVLEDRKLASLLDDPARIEASGVATANRLTQAKMATLALSGTGMPLFFALGGLRSLVKGV